MNAKQLQEEITLKKYYVWTQGVRGSAWQALGNLYGYPTAEEAFANHQMYLNETAYDWVILEALPVASKKNPKVGRAEASKRKRVAGKGERA